MENLAHDVPMSKLMEPSMNWVAVLMAEADGAAAEAICNAVGGGRAQNYTSHVKEYADVMTSASLESAKPT